MLSGSEFQPFLFFYGGCNQYHFCDITKLSTTVSRLIQKYRVLFQLAIHIRSNIDLALYWLFDNLSVLSNPSNIYFTLAIIQYFLKLPFNIYLIFSSEKSRQNVKIFPEHAQVTMSDVTSIWIQYPYRWCNAYRAHLECK